MDKTTTKEGFSRIKSIVFLLISLLLFLLCAGLIVGFVLMNLYEWQQYNATLNSAPWYLFVLVEIIEFLLPALVCLIVGIVLLRKRKKVGQ